MIRFYQSRHLDTLADFCAQLLKKAPLEDVFVPEMIVVQHAGIRHWLNLALVKRNGSAANLNLLSPAALVWHLMGCATENAPSDYPFTKDNLCWRLFTLLPTCIDNPAFAARRDYITASEETRFYFAKKIADCFDQYLMARWDWLVAWQNGQLLNLGDDEIWQAQLWRLLTQTVSPPYAIDQLTHSLSGLDPAKLPQRLLLFGITHLVPAYLGLLKSLSHVTDVCGFVLNPCHGYWADEVQPQDTLGEDKLFQAPDVGSKLLSQWGYQGRVFLHQLVSDDAVDCRDLDPLETEPTPTELSRLQQAIFLAGSWQPNPSPGPSSYPTHNPSIVFHVAPSPLRELEILKDQLLSHFMSDETLTPDQVVILAPDMAPYIAIIPAIFGEPGDPQHIPYRVVSHAMIHEHPLLGTFMACLETVDSRFVARDVTALLNCPAIQRRFDLSPVQLTWLDQWIDHAMIRWGRDAQHRGDCGAPEETASSWRLGLDRLLLGGLLPLDMLPHQHPLWGGLLPLAVPLADLPVLASLGDFFDVLNQWALEWREPTDGKGWAQRLSGVLDTLFKPDDVEVTALNLIRQALAELAQCPMVEGIPSLFGLPICRAWLKQRLQRLTQRDFFKGALTFSSINAMQGVPFRVIGLIGLNQDVFPRQTSLNHLNLMSHAMRFTDCSPRDEDCYAFLTSVLAAQDTLYLSWVGRSQYSDDALPPSTLVDGLREALMVLRHDTPAPIATSEDGGVDGQSVGVTVHPLQPFSSRYYDGCDTHLISFNHNYAKGLSQPACDNRPFTRGLPAGDTTQHLITGDELLRFWRSPSRAWLFKQLALSIDYQKKIRSEEEPLVLDVFSYQAIYDEWFKSCLAGVASSSLKARLMASGKLPPGVLGLRWLDQLAQQVDGKKSDVANETLLPPLPFEIVCPEGVTLTGVLNGLRPSGLWCFLPEKANAYRVIEVGLWYWILNSVAPTGVVPQVQLFHGEGCRLLAPSDPQTAQSHLKAWVKWMQVGWRDPLPFFPSTSLAAAQALADGKTQEDAKDKAFKTFQEHQRGSLVDKTREENRLVFRQREPLEEPLFWQLVNDLMVPLVKDLRISG